MLVILIAPFHRQIERFVNVAAFPVNTLRPVTAKSSDYEQSGYYLETTQLASDEAHCSSNPTKTEQRNLQRDE